MADIKSFGEQLVAFFSSERQGELIRTIGMFLLVIVIGVLLTLLIAHIVRAAMTRGKVDPSLQAFFTRSVKLVGFIITAIAALSELGVSTTGLIASFTAALAAVALALKDGLSDIASGIIILFTRPFVTGDFIEVGEYRGFVQKIDLIHTNILTYDDTNVIFPNSKLTTDRVNNYTSHDKIRVFILVPVGYNADIDEAERVLKDTAMRCPGAVTEGEYAPRVRLEYYGDSALQLSVKCWCSFEDYWTVYYYLMEEMKKNLDRAGIPIPYNQLDVHMVEPDKR